MTDGWTGKTDEYLATVITNDGFYPDLTLGDLQRDYRIPAEFAEDTVKRHLTVAVIEINSRLETKKTEWVTAGSATLEAVSAEKIGDEFILIAHYMRSVFCRAKALLLQQFATLNRKNAAQHAANESDENQQHWFSESDLALRKLTGEQSQYGIALL